MKTREAILEELKIVFKTVFKKDSITINMETTADDLKEWNSLTHMKLIDAVEQYFNCEFNFNEVVKFKNVGDMVDTILNKIN